MKIALLGNGKTGQYVAKLYPQNLTIFNTLNPPTLNSLAQCDVVISFLPGEAFIEYMPVLLESRLPVICASTGFSWPQGMDENLKMRQLKWVYANNFSLGMNIIKLMLENLNLAQKIFADFQCNIHEVHHVHKKDAPSGTAKSFKQWLNLPCDITSERTGDVVGEHVVKLETPFETIRLSHSAKSRELFAQGALFAAQKITSDSNINFGLHHFDQIVKNHLNL